jgi:chitinase
MARGVPPRKLLLGIPFFGQRFDDASAVHEPVAGAATSVLGYAEIAPLVGNGWIRAVDAAAGVPYLLRGDGPGFISYDDPASVFAKCKYVKARAVGGVIIWHLGQDSVDGRQPLLASIRMCTDRSPADRGLLVRPR